MGLTIRNKQFSLLILIFFLISIPIVFSAPGGSSCRTSAPAPCKTFPVNSCYDKSGFRAGIGDLTLEDFSHYFGETACIRETVSIGCGRKATCSCSGRFEDEVKQTDADQSSGACSCIAGSGWDSQGKCCGDDVSDCGVVVKGSICRIDANYRQSSWVDVASNKGDVVFLGCQDTEYLSDGTEWTPCIGDTFQKEVNDHTYLCVGGRSLVTEEVTSIVTTNTYEWESLDAVSSLELLGLTDEDLNGSKFKDLDEDGYSPCSNNQPPVAGCSSGVDVDNLCYTSSDLNGDGLYDEIDDVVTGYKCTVKETTQEVIETVVVSGGSSGTQPIQTTVLKWELSRSGLRTFPQSSSETCSNNALARGSCPVEGRECHISRLDFSSGRVSGRESESFDESFDVYKCTPQQTTAQGLDSGSWIECCGSGSCNSDDNAGQRFSTGESITIDSTTYYCSSNNKFPTNLDVNTDDMRRTCVAAGYVWTGSLCCSEDDDPGEYYNDPGGLGSCWNKAAVISVGSVPNIDNVASDNGILYGCNVQDQSLLNLLDSHTSQILIQNKNYCFQDNRKLFYCSYDDVWEFSAGQDRSSQSTVIPEVNPNPQQQTSCCAADQCWDGGTCRNNQRDNPFEDPINDFRCIDGDWTQASKKSTPDGIPRGYCPENSQCLVDPFGNPGQDNQPDLNPVCISNEQFIVDDYCENGEWSTRTKFVALQLIDIAGTNDFVVFCDTPQNVLNDLDYTIQGQPVQNLVSIQNTNNFCVLSFKEQVIPDASPPNFSSNWSIILQISVSKFLYSTTRFLIDKSSVPTPSTEPRICLSPFLLTYSLSNLFSPSVKDLSKGSSTFPNKKEIIFSIGFFMKFIKVSKKFVVPIEKELVL